MSKMAKFLNAIGINTEEDGFEEYETPVEVERPSSFSSSMSGLSSSSSASSSRRGKGRIVDINATTQFKVVVIQPESFDEAREIADHLKDRKPVVVNLELVDKEVAHKIFDFLSGAIYALGGTIQRISTNIYLIAPYNVAILGDFRDELKNKGFLWNS